MATVSTHADDDCDLALTKGSKRLSMLASARSLDSLFKSDSKMEMDLLAKEKEIDRQISLAEKTSLCFLVDCTGSMQRWIDKVKENIKFWSEQLHAKHTNIELNVAFVRYTDYDQPVESRTTTFDFTVDLDDFYHFVDAITTPDGVGGDTPEDIFGGLNAVLKLSWPRVGTKVLIHIADAPCHGQQYHDSTIWDKFPKGDPAGIQLDDLMGQLARENIRYFFGYIKKSRTLTMVKAFSSSLQAQSKNVHSITQFDASDPNKLLEGVFSSVTCSITATLATLMTGRERPAREYTIDENIPVWDELPSQSVLITPPPKTGSGVTIMPPNQPMKIKIAPQPFARGEQRIVYHAFDEDNAKHLVVKCSRFTDVRSNSIKRCLETAQIHAIAANYCAEFNREKPLMKLGEIQFVGVGVMQATDEATHKIRYLTYEPYLGDSGYTKFNTNYHAIPQIDDDILSATCQAFSHYTWKKSGKKLVVCDLQGVKFDNRAVLTDPVIHYTHVLCHGSTNLGTRGIKQFFRVHKCNDICRAMNLEHPAEAE